MSPTSRDFSRLVAETSHLWFWAILMLALGLRLFWLLIYQGHYGYDAIRYLWISQHLTFGEWDKVPQLWTQPLLPLSIGMLSFLTGDHIWSARFLGILGNTLAVGSAMLLVRQGFPQRPALAWLTGLGLAFSHVWTQLAPFAVTENLFFPLVMGLLILFVRLFQKPDWPTGLIFGLFWGLAYLTRDNGLFFGLVFFSFLILAELVRPAALKEKILRTLRLAAPVLGILALILTCWMYWYYITFGIISLGEGRHFILNELALEGQGEHPVTYEQGGIGYLKLRPYEYMEFTRAPLPGDSRYPQGKWQILWGDGTWPRIKRNLHITFKEIKPIILPGLIGLVLLFRKGYLFNANTRVMWWALGASLVLLGLHLIGLVKEARHIAWFFPWLFLGSAATFLWTWERLPHWLPQKKRPAWTVLLLGLVGLFLLLYPDYIKEAPHKWRIRHIPHVYQLAGEYLMEHHGPGAVISSRQVEVVYRCQGGAIGVPEGSPADIMEWLYLGKADYLLFINRYPRTEAQQFFWGDPDLIRQQYPELELLTEFHSENSNYPQHARLFRFHPQAATFEQYRAKYPWAGTPPRPPGAGKATGQPGSAG